jgi:hypothetical protein
MTWLVVVVLATCFGLAIVPEVQYVVSALRHKRIKERGFEDRYQLAAEREVDALVESWNNPRAPLTLNCSQLGYIRSFADDAIAMEMLNQGFKVTEANFKAYKAWKKKVS